MLWPLEFEKQPRDLRLFRAKTDDLLSGRDPISRVNSGFAGHAIDISIAIAIAVAIESSIGYRRKCHPPCR